MNYGREDEKKKGKTKKNLASWSMNESSLTRSNKNGLHPLING
jgi:hypothetical protein